MKRLLILSDEFPPFPGGIARYAGEIAQAAVDLGFHVHVVAPSYAKSLPASDAVPSGCRVHRVPRSAFGMIRLLQSACATLWCILRMRPDIIHATDLHYGLILQVLAPFLHRRYLVSVHGTDILTMRHARSVRVLTGGNPLNRAAAILCNSNFTRDLALQYFRLDPARVHVTHLGVSERWFALADPAQQAAVRQYYGIPHEATLVLTVARVEPRKGQLSVIQAMEALNAEGFSSLSYLIIGKADDSDYVRAVRAAAAKARTPIRLLGVVPEADLRALYATSFAFCMPGLAAPDRIEGFGLAYLEAAASGLPSIATRLGGAPEAVQHGYSGLLLDEPTPEHISSALRTLLNDPSTYRTMRRNATWWAREFSWAKCAAKSYSAVPC